MSVERPINWKIVARAVVALLMLILWSLAVFSGVLLWAAPRGPRAGYRVLWLDLAKREWSDWHLAFSLAAIGVTLIHVIIDWKGFWSCMRYVTSLHRSSNTLEKS